MRLIYITEGSGSAINSQVYELISELAKISSIYEIHLCLSVNDKMKLNYIFSEKVKVHYFKNFGMYPIVDIYNIFLLRKILKDIQIIKTDILHVRSEYLGYIVSKAINKSYDFQENLYIDIRGAIKEEIECSNMHKIKKSIKVKYIEKIFRYLIKKNIFYNVVSNELKTYIKNKYLINNISIIPCIAGKNFSFNLKNRILRRKELGLENDDILFIFSSGALNSWQNNDEVVDLFSKENKLLMLGKKKYRNKNVISKYVDFKDVSSYLSAADIGIILRNDSIVNKVASPIKFSEYVACGLPVITDGNVNQINEFIGKNNCGYIKHNLRNIDGIVENLKLLDRNSISKKGIKMYGIEVIANLYLNEYKKIRNNNENIS